MITKFDVGDTVKIEKESFYDKYEVISIVVTCKKDINYEIKDSHGRNRIVEEDKLVKAPITKEEARTMALKYVNNYLVEHDSDDYHIIIKKEESHWDTYYCVYVSELNGVIKKSKVFRFSKEVQ